MNLDDLKILDDSGVYRNFYRYLMIELTKIAHAKFKKAPGYAGPATGQMIAEDDDNVIEVTPLDGMNSKIQIDVWVPTDGNQAKSIKLVDSVRSMLSKSKLSFRAHSAPHMLLKKNRKWWVEEFVVEAYWKKP